MTISPASSSLVPPTRIVPPTDNLLPAQKATRPGDKVEAEVSKPANSTTDIVEAKLEAPGSTGGGGIDIRV